MPEIYYKLLCGMVDPASGKIIAVEGQHIRKEYDQGERITALINEHPGLWQVIKRGDFLFIDKPTEGLVNSTTILDALQRALTDRNREKDQTLTLFWARWLLRDTMWLLERVGNG